MYSGQLKSAYHTAREAQSLGGILDRLLQTSFAVAKQVRTRTAIGASAVSVASAGVSLAKQIFADLSEHSALLVGAGETIELVARHLREQGLKRIIVANRTLQRAQDLAIPFGGAAITLDAIPEQLSEADIVVSSTASTEPVVWTKDIRAACKRRKHRPMLMLDLAVPRDIESDAADLDDVYLYSVDDLQDVITDNLRSRSEAAIEAQEIIELQVEHFMSWMRSLNSVDTVRALRADAELSRDEVLAKALNLLDSGQDPQEVLQRLAHTLTNKLIHRPSTQLMQAAEQDQDDLLKAAHTLFRLDETDCE